MKLIDLATYGIPFTCGQNKNSFKGKQSHLNEEEQPSQFFVLNKGPDHDVFEFSRSSSNEINDEAPKYNIQKRADLVKLLDSYFS